MSDIVEALQGDPEPLPDSYYSVAVAVRELRMHLAKSVAESAEFRSHAWSEQKELRGRLEQAELERDAAQLEIRAMRALLRWVMANPSRCIGNCCGELGAFTVYHASADDEISEDGSGATVEALADALGLDWREP